MFGKFFIVVIVVGILYLVFSNKGAEMMQRYIDSHPNEKWSPGAQFKLASWLFFTMRYKKSLTSYQILMSRYPNHHNVDEALFRTAECYENLNDIDIALAKYREFVYLYPNHPWATRANNKITEITLLK